MQQYIVTDQGEEHWSQRVGLGIFFKFNFYFLNILMLASPLLIFLFVLLFNFIKNIVDNIMYMAIILLKTLNYE